jgi:hypothetical protein
MVALVVMGFFWWHLSQLAPPIPLRRLHAAAALVYGAVALAATLRLLHLADEARALLLSFSIALPLFILDAFVAPPKVTDRPRWEVKALSDPHVSFRYRPNTTGRIYYPGNPRGYFSTNRSPRDGWSLELHERAVAELENPETDPGRVRVTLTPGSPAEAWHVKLQQSPFEIQGGKEYALHFRARADAPRRISCSVGQNHEPWKLLSPYFEVEIEKDWRPFQLPFTAIASDPVARIAFDLAESDAPVELTDVVLRDLSTGQDVAPSPQFFVSYRFNSLGFRGPDYAIPTPEGTFRILALGDSYTLGEGVNEQDTFSAQLESRLNAAARARSQPIRYEVINSGVGGYSTEQERLSYELFSSAYMPQLVVLTMVFNDDLSFAEEVQQGHFTPPEESPASNLWARLEKLRRPVRTYDYSTCVRELLLLDESCRRNGANLAVVIFRQSIPPDPWHRLVTAVNEGVQGTDIPVLDLGPALAGQGSHQELIVHPNDGHPNEIAHRVAAEEIERFLRAEGLLPGASSQSTARSADRPAGGDGAPRQGLEPSAGAQREARSDSRGGGAPRH